MSNNNSLMNKIKGHPGFLPFWKGNISTDNQAKPADGDAKQKQGGGQGEG